MKERRKDSTSKVKEREKKRKGMMLNGDCSFLYTTRDP
jgi:hypothetical protein